jgi:uncharacterized membrane protein YjgN (DUF898 family)
LGIYGSWFKINLRNYVLSNVRFGDAELNYDGDGWGLLAILKVTFLPTLGIYFFLSGKRYF